MKGRLPGGVRSQHGLTQLDPHGAAICLHRLVRASAATVGAIGLGSWKLERRAGEPARMTLRPIYMGLSFVSQETGIGSRARPVRTTRDPASMPPAGQPE